MLKINFAILFLLSLVSRVVISTPSCPVTTTPTYCPFFLNSQSDIPLAATSYNAINRSKLMNGTVQSFESALTLLSGVTDPLLNGSSITTGVQNLYDSAVTLLSAHVTNWVPILNNYLRIDAISPLTTYQSSYNSLVAMKTPYLPLYSQAIALYQQIVSIENNLSGTTLTSTQSAQLAKYALIKPQVVKINEFFNAGNVYLSSDIGYASDINELPDAFVNGDCDIDTCRDALMMYTELFLAHSYDFYISLNSLNQLNI